MASKGQNYADTFVFKYVLSCCAATVAETATYPLDLTKTRLQIQGEGGSVAVEKKKGFIKTAYGIAQKEGALQLWQGLAPAVYRHIVYTGCRLGFYEYIRENIIGRSKDGSFPYWRAMIGGLSAGAMAQFIASPTDLVKVRMQMEGKRKLDGRPPRVHNTWHAFSTIVKEGGVRGLWKGWVPNVQRAALVNLGDLATYDTAKQNILRHTSLQDNHFTHALSSCCSGFVSATLGTPADVVKTRVMNQPTDANGRGLLYKSSLDCLQQAVNKEGFFALYKGFIPIWGRMAPWSLTFWLSYEQIRSWAGTSPF